MLLCSLFFLAPFVRVRRLLLASRGIPTAATASSAVVAIPVKGMVPEGLAFCAAAPGEVCHEHQPEPAADLGRSHAQKGLRDHQLPLREALVAKAPPTLSATAAAAPIACRINGDATAAAVAVERGAGGQLEEEGVSAAEVRVLLSPQCGVPPGRVQRHHTQPPTRPQCRRCLRCLHLFAPLSAAAKALLFQRRRFHDEHGR